MADSFIQLRLQLPEGTLRGYHRLEEDITGWKEATKDTPTKDTPLYVKVIASEGGPCGQNWTRVNSF